MRTVKWTILFCECKSSHIRFTYLKWNKMTFSRGPVHTLAYLLIDTVCFWSLQNAFRAYISAWKIETESVSENSHHLLMSNLKHQIICKCAQCRLVNETHGSTRTLKKKKHSKKVTTIKFQFVRRFGLCFVWCIVGTLTHEQNKRWLIGDGLRAQNIMSPMFGCYRWRRRITSSPFLSDRWKRLQFNEEKNRIWVACDNVPLGNWQMGAITVCWKESAFHLPFYMCDVRIISFHFW